MVKRTVQFTVKADGGVTPAIPLFGGIKGEHNATVLSVTMDSGVYNGETVRLSFTTGDGTVLSSDLIEEIVVDGDKASFTYPLPRLLTIAAGQLCMRVVLTTLDEHGAEAECRHSDEMVLYFDHADVENGTPFWTGVSEMLARTTTAKDDAVAAARDANIEAIKANVSASDAQGFADAAEESAAKAAESEKKTADDRSAIEAVGELVGKQYSGAVEAKNYAQESARQAAQDRSTAETKAGEAASSATRAEEAREAAQTAKDAAEAAAEAAADSESVARNMVTAATEKAVEACDWSSEAEAAAKAAEASAAEATAARDAIESVENTANEAFSRTLDQGMRLTVIENEAVKYKGKVATGAVLAATPDAKYRDVWFVENEKCFYMYDGEDWIPFGNGAGGANGITPHIGANGNWFIGDEDTGVSAVGADGKDYVLTDADKAEIAAICAALLEDGNGVAY